MKKWIIIIGAVGIFSFLTFSFFNEHIDGVKEEKNWYIGQLNFDFSGQIDSVILLTKDYGLLYFHVTRGTFDKERENQLSRELKFNGDLRFILDKPENKIAIATSDADLYLLGDSLTVDANENKFKIFRKGQPIADKDLVSSLNGRPF